MLRWPFRLLLALTVPCSVTCAGEVFAQSAGVVAPQPLTAIEVTYPEGAHGDQDVDLELLIAEDGTVARVTVRSGTGVFAEAAHLAARDFRFSPATRNGIPVRARIALRITFRQPKPPPQAVVAPDQTAEPQQEQSASAAPATASQPPEAPSEEPVEIKVLGEQRADIGSIHIPREEARRVPGAFADPFRVVEILPGVAPVLSGLPYYYVRGAPPGSLGYYIDGIRVPILFHVGPGPSVIAPALIDRVDLFPGAYPVRFGRSAGGVIAGETQAPSERPRAEGQARIFDASAMLEQPFADGKASALVGGRYSYTQAILAAVAPAYELGYGDYQARLAYAVTPKDRLSVFAFGGFDFLRNQRRNITLFDIEFHRLDLRWDKAWKTGRLRVALTGSLDRVHASPEDDEAAGSALRQRGVRLRAELEQELSDELRLRSGADISADYVQGDREQMGNSFRSYPDRTDHTLGAYSDLVWRPSRGVELVPGVRIDYQRSRGQTYTFFEPRLSTRTRLARGIAHLAGFGIAHQLPATSVRMPGRRPNIIELSRQEAVQASQGVEYVLPDAMLGRTTLFHQYVDVGTVGVHGRSYGLEQFIRRDFTHRLGGFISYTLSRAEGAFGSERVLSSFDRTHVLSAAFGYDLGAGFRIGARGYFASGRSYRVDCPTEDCALGGDPAAPRTFFKDIRLPAFFRLDTRIEKTFRFRSGPWLTLTFEWFNALLTSEVEDVIYTPQGFIEDRQSPLTLPSIGVEFGY